MRPGILTTTCLAAATLLLLGGCLSSSDQASRYLLAEKLPPRSVEQVEILRTPPIAPFEIIAEFQSRGESASDMQRKAAAVGADAVIVVLAGGFRATNAEWASDSITSDTYTRIIGTAIRRIRKN